MIWLPRTSRTLITSLWVSVFKPHLYELLFYHIPIRVGSYLRCKFFFIASLYESQSNSRCNCDHLDLLLLCTAREHPYSRVKFVMMIYGNFTFHRLIALPYLYIEHTTSLYSGHAVRLEHVLFYICTNLFLKLPQHCICSLRGFLFYLMLALFHAFTFSLAEKKIPL